MDQYPIGLDHAQLHGTRPEGRNCRQQGQTAEEPSCRVERPAEPRTRAGPQHEQADHHEPRPEARYVTRRHVETAAAQGKPEDQRSRSK
jgi:hypothetical protein